MPFRRVAASSREDEPERDPHARATAEQGSAIVYGAGVDNSGQGLTFQIAWPSSDV
jgi:hypothetical protein